MSDEIKKDEKRIDGGGYTDRLQKEFLKEKASGIVSQTSPYTLATRIYKTAFYFDEGEGTESYLINLNDYNNNPVRLSKIFEKRKEILDDEAKLRRSNQPINRTLEQEYIFKVCEIFENEARKILTEVYGVKQSDIDTATVDMNIVGQIKNTGNIMIARNAIRNTLFTEATKVNTTDITTRMNNLKSTIGSQSKTRSLGLQNVVTQSRKIDLQNPSSLLNRSQNLLQQGTLQREIIEFGPNN